MRHILIIACLFICSTTYGQIIKSDNPNKNQAYFLNKKIYDLRASFKNNSEKTKRDQLEAFYLLTKEDSIVISIDLTQFGDIDIIDRMNEHGANLRPVLMGYNYYSGYIQIDSLLVFPMLFPLPDIFIELGEITSEGDNEGPVNTNSSTYETGGGNPNAGSGRIIAIIDCAWEGYNATAAAGAAPSNFVYRDCSSGSCSGTPNLSDLNIFSGGALVDHGTKATQIVFDHAPAATYLLYKSCGTVGRAAAINDAVNRGAHIISCSESGYNTGWNDNSGLLCMAVNNAINSNTLMFFSSGNRNGGGHWQGNFKDDNDNNFHEWSGNDELNDVQVLPGDPLRLMMQWASSIDDYDIRYYDNNINRIDNCQKTDQFEDCTWVNNTADTVNVKVAVLSKNSNQPEFEIINRSSNQVLQHASSSNQTTSPGNCTINSNVLIVAAVNQMIYDSSTAPIMDFSSVGPTNGNKRSVELTGPTNNSVTDFNPNNGAQFATTFGGTSCATPNVAGAVAAFWSKHPTLNATGIRAIILDMAQDYKDWGTIGYDNVFGYGGIYLYEYNPKNIFITEIEHLFNFPYDPQLPYSSMFQVNEESDANKEAIYLGKIHLRPTIVIDKPMIYKSAVKNVILK